MFWIKEYKIENTNDIQTESFIEELTTDSPKIIYIFLYSLYFLTLMTICFFANENVKIVYILLFYALLIYSCIFIMFLLYYLLVVFISYFYFQHSEFRWIFVFFQHFVKCNIGLLCGKEDLFYVIIINLISLCYHIYKYYILKKNPYNKKEIQKLLFISWLTYLSSIIILGTGVTLWIASYSILIIRWIIFKSK